IQQPIWRKALSLAHFSALFRVTSWSTSKPRASGNPHSERRKPFRKSAMLLPIPRARQTQLIQLLPGVYTGVPVFVDAYIKGGPRICFTREPRLLLPLFQYFM